MGVYTTRYIEAKISECRGYVYNKEDFPSVEEVIETICDKLLANVVMESYRYEIERVKETV